MEAAALAARGGSLRMLATIPRLCSGRPHEIDEILRSAVDANDVPGVVAMAATDREVVYGGAYGKRDLSKAADVTLDTVFWIASMTKAVTAAAAMRLIELERMDLEQPVGELLPELASPLVLEGFNEQGMPRLRPAKRAVRVRHLLTHTSGFTYDIWDHNTGRYEKYAGLPTVATCKNAALRTPLAFDPGDRWEYGISIDWLGKVIEAVTGQSLDVHLREQIFAPLGMKDTTFVITPGQRSRLAVVHARKADGSLEPTPFEMPQNPEFYMGGGGLYATASDYLSFQRMLLNGGSFNGARILKPQTVAQMARNQIGKLNVGALKTMIRESSNDVDFFPGMKKKWGFSSLINTKRGPAGRSAGTLSWGGLGNTYFWIDPSERVAGVIMMQILPFADAKALRLYSDFEKGVYKRTASA
jgi:methyl acetate hydrolase